MLFKKKSVKEDEVVVQEVVPAPSDKGILANDVLALFSLMKGHSYGFASDICPIARCRSLFSADSVGEERLRNALDWLGKRGVATSDGNFINWNINWQCNGGCAKWNRECFADRSVVHFPVFNKGKTCPKFVSSKLEGLFTEKA